MESGSAVLPSARSWRISKDWGEVKGISLCLTQGKSNGDLLKFSWKWDHLSPLGFTFNIWVYKMCIKFSYLVWIIKVHWKCTWILHSGERLPTYFEQKLLFTCNFSQRFRSVLTFVTLNSQSPNVKSKEYFEYWFNRLEIWSIYSYFKCFYLLHYTAYLCLNYHFSVSTNFVASSVIWLM